MGLSGPSLVFVISLLIGGLCAAVLGSAHPGEAEVRAVIRLTAFTSLTCFLLAFTASALVRLAPGPSTRWVLVNRRYLGLSFAVSHLAHLAAIVAFARMSPTFQLQTLSLIGGGLAYVFVVLLAVTSNDAALRLLGGRRWSALHTTGVYYIWFIFIFTYVKSAAHSPFHAAMTAVLVAALGLRMYARVAVRARRTAQAVS